MFHVYVQRFDRMDEKFLDGELNRALLGLGLHVLLPRFTNKCTSHLPKSQIFLNLTKNIKNTNIYHA
jgi:hypothetical protein